MKTTAEQNRLIAEFMDCVHYPEDGIVIGPCPWDAHQHEPQECEFTDDQILFHTSWNWLMPVVERLHEMGVKATIERMSCTITHTDPLRPELTFCGCMVSGVTMNAVHAAVVEFIEWYNKTEANP